ncbi:hypothetical protein PIB30_105841, partial [Stylosanthes scabra]|nr:hypothetical protein [Stylosanthes scabra]
SLLNDIEKNTRYDKLTAKLTELGELGPLPVLALSFRLVPALIQNAPSASIPGTLSQSLPSQPLPASSVLEPISMEGDEVGMEGVLSLREKMEKDLVAAKDQVEILTVERDFALAASLLQKEIYEMKEKMELLEGDRLSTLDRVRHLNLSPGVDFSAITLSTRWDLKTSSVRVSPKEPEEDLIEKQP